MADHLLVSETFGPTLQGEGPSAGQLAHFLRLGLCNLDCAWCDTPYTWDWTGKNGPPQDKKALYQATPTELAGKFAHVPLLVVTGGEPLLQATALARLAGKLDNGTLRIEVETNGTRRPGALADYQHVTYNVSPKLQSAGCTAPPDQRTRLLGVWAELAWAGRACFKFVVCDVDRDVAEVDALVRRYEMPDYRVWLMPEGRTAAGIAAGMQRLAPVALARGWNVSSRLHVLLWGDERGR